MITVNNPDVTDVNTNANVKMDTAIANGDNKTIRFAKKYVNMISQQSIKWVLQVTCNPKKGRKIKQLKRFYHYKGLIKMKTNAAQLASVDLRRKMPTK